MLGMMEGTRYACATPESSASVMAALQYAALPLAARSPIAVAVISETTATGPTASTRPG